MAARFEVEMGEAVENPTTDPISTDVIADDVDEISRADVETALLAGLADPSNARTVDKFYSARLVELEQRISGSA
eukprot:SAG31_NODE_19668_length_595_cov_0.816532_1_plen_74_part_10